MAHVYLRAEESSIGTRSEIDDVELGPVSQVLERIFNQAGLEESFWGFVGKTRKKSHLVTDIVYRFYDEEAKSVILWVKANEKVYRVKLELPDDISYREIEARIDYRDKVDTLSHKELELIITLPKYLQVLESQRAALIKEIELQKRDFQERQTSIRSAKGEMTQRIIAVRKLIKRSQNLLG